MKLIAFTILFTMLVVTGRSQSDSPAHKHVSILSISKEVFYFKVDADFIGATVEVTDSTGTVFYSTALHNKRNLIDFFNLEIGEYTIHLERNGVTEDYQVQLSKKAGHSARFIALKSGLRS